MSLLSDAMEACTMLDRVTRPDGYGGFISTWTDGAPFQAAVIYTSPREARLAGVQDVHGVYTVTTEKSVNLQYHDVFRRERDGKLLRVTTDGDDKATPAASTLNMRQVDAEEWRLPDG